jgi:FKBP-type peptidyl-prolyl cis-trans isomerase 2
MKKLIEPGMRVTFDTDEGPLAGTCAEIRKDIGNGQPYALVDVDHAMAGAQWRVPVASVEPEQRTARA